MTRTTSLFVFHDTVFSHDPLRLHPDPFHCSPETQNGHAKRPIGGPSPNSQPVATSLCRHRDQLCTTRNTGVWELWAQIIPANAFRR